MNEKLNTVPSYQVEVHTDSHTCIVDVTALVSYLAKKQRLTIEELSEDVNESLAVLTGSLNFQDKDTIPDNFQNIHNTLHDLTKILRGIKVEFKPKSNVNDEG